MKLLHRVGKTTARMSYKKTETNCLGIGSKFQNSKAAAFGLVKSAKYGTTTRYATLIVRRQRKIKSVCN